MELDDFLVTALLGCVSLTGPQLRPPGHPQPWPQPSALRASPCCLSVWDRGDPGLAAFLLPQDREEAAQRM